MAGYRKIAMNLITCLPGSSISKAETMENLADAERFVTEIEKWLKQENWM
jgi:hypothetical protein